MCRRGGGKLELGSLQPPRRACVIRTQLTAPNMSKLSKSRLNLTHHTNTVQNPPTKHQETLKIPEQGATKRLSPTSSALYRSKESGNNREDGEKGSKYAAGNATRADTERSRIAGSGCLREFIVSFFPTSSLQDFALLYSALPYLDAYALFPFLSRCSSRRPKPLHGA